MTFSKISGTLQIVVIALGLRVGQAQEKVILDEEIKPIYFESISYPLTARLKHEQGSVVVLGRLDADGKVISADAISGPRDLIQDAVSNAKKWRFKPNSDRMVVIIYEFRIDGLCHSPCPSHFAFKPPNVATITIGEAVLDHQ